MSNPYTSPNTSPKIIIMSSRSIGAVFVISMISVTVSLVQTKRNLQQLHDLIAHSCTVTVLRGDKGIQSCIIVKRH